MHCTVCTSVQSSSPPGSAILRGCLLREYILRESKLREYRLRAIIKQQDLQTLKTLKPNFIVIATAAHLLTRDYIILAECILAEYRFAEYKLAENCHTHYTRKLTNL